LGIIVGARGWIIAALRAKILRGLELLGPNKFGAYVR